MSDLPLPISSMPTSAARSRRMNPWVGLLLWLLAVAAVAVIGSQFQPDAWYAALEKPSWNPPSRVFGPVWTTLYLLMAIAAWLVWRAPGPIADRRRALTLMGVQLVLNALWSPLFFGAHAIGLALVDIVALFVFVVLTTVAFARVRKLAAVMMLPYIAWVGFAAALNAALYMMNR